MTTSVTQKIAEWIVEARYDDVPPLGVVDGAAWADSVAPGFLI